MTHLSAKFSEPLPREVRTCLEGLGQRVKTARVRRGLSTEVFAQECGIGRRSLYRIETGEPGVALGTFLSALWKLGLLESVQGVANPDDDEHGKILEAARRPERVRSQVLQTMTSERPKAGRSRPSPAGIKESGKATIP